jgi:hypothetical protein
VGHAKLQPTGVIRKPKEAVGINDHGALKSADCFEHPCCPFATAKSGAKYQHICPGQRLHNSLSGIIAQRINPHGFRKSGEQARAIFGRSGDANQASTAAQCCFRRKHGGSTHAHITTHD